MNLVSIGMTEEKEPFDKLRANGIKNSDEV
jgi:hypothetical protein